MRLRQIASCYKGAWRYDVSPVCRGWWPHPGFWGFERGRVFGDLATPSPLGVKNNTIQLRHWVSRSRQIWEDSGRVILTDLGNTMLLDQRPSCADACCNSETSCRSAGRCCCAAARRDRWPGPPERRGWPRNGSRALPPDGLGGTVVLMRRSTVESLDAGTKSASCSERTSGTSADLKMAQLAHSRTCWPTSTISWRSFSIRPSGMPRKCLPHASTAIAGNNCSGRDATGLLRQTPIPQRAARAVELVASASWNCHGSGFSAECSGFGLACSGHWSKPLQRHLQSVPWPVFNVVESERRFLGIHAAKRGCDSNHGETAVPVPAKIPELTV